jgi:SPP1 gp7 family putative phage head morphogenesis protein
MNLNTKVYDKKLDRAAMLQLYEKRLTSKVGVLLNEHKKRVTNLVMNHDKKTFNEKLDKEILTTFNRVNNLTSGELVGLSKNQMSFTAQIMDDALGDVWRTKKPVRSIAENIVLKQPVVNRVSLKDGWGGIGAGERRRIEKTVKAGIQSGLTATQMVTKLEKAHKLTRLQSESLVITAITSVHSQSDHAVYSANSKALDGWEYVAVLDSRTTPICRHRDGTVYPLSDTVHAPPSHWRCRSSTVPIIKSWAALKDAKGIDQLRSRNIRNLSKERITQMDGMLPSKESYQMWLMRQSSDVQLKHLGDQTKVDLFRSGALDVSKFTDDAGRAVGLRELKQMTSYTAPSDVRRFADAKEKLTALDLTASTPEELFLKRKALKEYYLLQAGELDGTLSLTNYRGVLIGNKGATKRRVLTSPPREEQMKFNPVTGRYEDVRMYQPTPYVLSNNLKLVEESQDLLPKDKEFIKSFTEELSDKMGVNERAAVVDNLRNSLSRYRKNPQPWENFKAVTQAQMKFDVMNVSDTIETQLRKDRDVLKRLTQDNYIDPVLGNTQLDDIHDNFIKNIEKKLLWEDTVAPQLAMELRGMPTSFGRLQELFTPGTYKEIKGAVDLTMLKVDPVVWKRLDEGTLQQFYLRFANRLALADTPDRDQLAMALGRDLYNSANMNGDRNKWYKMGMAILDDDNSKKFFEIETFGVQKRRMKSRLSDKYFGPYYDTLSYNVRVTDKRVQEYAQLTRKVDVGLRVGVTSEKNRLVIREGYKTYFIKKPTGYVDTRIPVTSTGSYGDFPTELIDKNMADSLNWASSAQYKVDEDFYDFTKKLLYFEDDKGAAKHFNELNEYRKYIVSRGDAYERFKAMDWLRNNGRAFSNHAFVDHRARIYERGFIGPQSGESFRPYLNTATAKNFSEEGYLNLQDQIGSFLGGLNDNFEGNHSGLTFTGRQKIAAKWRPEMVKLGNQMRRGKPADMRAILQNEMLSQIDGEDQGKFMRLVMETAKLDEFLTKTASPVIKPTASLLSERQDVAGLARLLGVNNKTSPGYVGSPSEVIKAQTDIIKLVRSGKVNEAELQSALRWLHTADIELTDVRRERATYKTFDHKTGEKLSAAEITANKAKFKLRSKGNTRQYIATQVVEELGELLEEHLKLRLPRSANVFKVIEAQKRALKAVRFGDDTVIKDAASIYFGKTNREAAEIASKAAGLVDASKDSSKLIAELNKLLDTEVSMLKPLGISKEDIYSSSNLQNLKDYKISLALEQDASSSGAQIIALTTKNKQLAEMSNVVPTLQKRRLYDEIAAATYNDPEFIRLNARLNLTEKDLRKGAKNLAMVTFYGAGERTGIMNVEGKLARILEKQKNVLVIKAGERDVILEEISARAARYEKFDPVTAGELKNLRKEVKDVFDKGMKPEDDLLEQLYFLDNNSKEVLDKLSRSYDMVVTPNDFKQIAQIMSGHLAEEVPILKNFTRFFGRLAEDYLSNAKPSSAGFDWKTIAKTELRGTKKKGYVLPDFVSRIFGMKAGEPVSEKFLKRFGFWKPGGNLDQLLNGVDSPEARRTGGKFFKLEVKLPTVDLKKASLGSEKLMEFELFTANKLPKSWTNVPNVNFDGKVVEQNFTQTFEERLLYQDKDGNWVNNIMQVPQKTEASAWEQMINKEGKINDIADAGKARTAFGVNANHSNDATLVKNFHLWGKKNNIQTSSIHDAFFTNAADMVNARDGLRVLYADTLDSNVIKATLDEMLKRGLPRELYDSYLEEAIETGLIPVVGKSRVGGKLLRESDILKKEDVLRNVSSGFKEDYGWYGVN